MSTHEGFLAAIRSEPDDTTHRLIYADWLEEHGTTDLAADRAELIRVQLARETTDPTSDAWWDLRARERILLHHRGDALAAGVARFAEDCRFRGGFVEAAALPVESFLQHASDLRASGPLRGIALAGIGDRLTPELLAAFEGLRLWNVLFMVEGSLDPSAFAQALRPRHFDVNVSWLSFLLAGLEAGWPLRHLGLGTTRVPGPQGDFDRTLRFEEVEVYPLFNEPLPPSLVSLDLRGVLLDADQWDWLLGRSGMTQIEHLAYWVSDDTRNLELGYLSRQPTLANLRSLWIGGDPGDNFLPYGDSLRGLRQLIVQGDDWFDTTRNHQPDDLALPELTHLRQEYFRDGWALVNHLVEPDSWPALRVLELRRWQNNYLETVPYLLRTGVLPQLRRLEIPALPRDAFDEKRGELALTELSVTATDHATPIAAVSRSVVLPALVSLEIARARLDRPDDLEPLLDRSRFPRLRRLDIGGLVLAEPWRRRFVERFGLGAVFSPQPLTAFPVHERILEGWL